MHADIQLQTRRGQWPLSRCPLAPRAAPCAPCWGSAPRTLVCPGLAHLRGLSVFKRAHRLCSNTARTDRSRCFSGEVQPSRTRSSGVGRRTGWACHSSCGPSSKVWGPPASRRALHTPHKPQAPLSHVPADNQLRTEGPGWPPPSHVPRGSAQTVSCDFPARRLGPAGSQDGLGGMASPAQPQSSR